MALVSSGALQSCEDHLQHPLSASAVRLESLAFIRAQNGNASNSSVRRLFYFSLLRFLSSLSHRRGKFSLLASSVHLAHFSASALARESTPLPSTLLRSLYLAFTTTALCCFPSYKKPHHPFPTALRRAKSLKGLFCS